LDSHRAVAGLLLKNSINARDLSQDNASEGEKQAVAYVKSTILAGLQDKDQMIRQTVGAVITSLLTAEQPGGWPEALEALTTGKGSQDMNVVEVSDTDHLAFAQNLISVRILHSRKDYRGLSPQARRHYSRRQSPRPPRTRIYQVHRTFFRKDPKPQSFKFVLARIRPRSSAQRQHRWLHSMSLRPSLGR
jgi:hypothetical protein